MTDLGNVCRVVLRILGSGWDVRANQIDGLSPIQVVFIYQQQFYVRFEMRGHEILMDEDAFLIGVWSATCTKKFKEMFFKKLEDALPPRRE